MKLMTKKAALGALALIAATTAATAACGRVGALQSPATVEAQRREDAAKAARGDTRLPTGPVSEKGSSVTTRSQQGHNHDENAPLSTRDIQDPAQKLSPASTSPVAGAPDPLGSPVSTRPPG